MRLFSEFEFQQKLRLLGVEGEDVRSKKDALLALSIESPTFEFNRSGLLFKKGNLQYIKLKFT